MPSSNIVAQISHLCLRRVRESAVPAAKSSTVLKPPYIILTATTTAMNAATQAVERVSLRAGLPILAGEGGDDGERQRP